MEQFYITFGFGHHQPALPPAPKKMNRSLASHYTLVEAENEAEARAKISEVRGSRWAFIYKAKDKKECIDKYPMHFIELKDIKPQVGPNL